MEQPLVDRNSSLHISQSGAPIEATTKDQSEHYLDWPNADAFNNPQDTRIKRQIQISGHFPNHVAGELYRTGPGQHRMPRTKPGDGFVEVDHWFDGFTTTHRFELVRGSNGHCEQVWYSSYNQVDELLQNARHTGRIDGISFAQHRDPCDTFYKKFKSLFQQAAPENRVSSNIGVAFQRTLPANVEQAKNASGNIDGRRLITATTDASSTKTFDAESLEPLGVTKQENIHAALKGPLSGAHPQYDPETGDVYNYNLELGPRHIYRVFRANAKTGDVKILAEISGRDIKGAYIHSMFMTVNYVVLCIWPAYFKNKGISVLLERNILDALAFDAKSKCTWLVVDRKGNRGLVKKFTSPPFFCFHTSNAWEQGGEKDGEVDITLELATFENMDILKRFYYKNFLSNSPGVREFNATYKVPGLTMARYKLSSVPLKSTSAQVPTAVRIAAVPSPNAGDLQNINPLYACKPHRYVWSVLDTNKSSFLDSLGKTDMHTGECIRWCTPKHTPSEPVFVPVPGAVEEDEGHILTVVYDGEKGTSYLLCLDARSMQEVGRAEVGSAVGIGFHGLHVPTS